MNVHTPVPWGHWCKKNAQTVVKKRLKMKYDEVSLCHDKPSGRCGDVSKRCQLIIYSAVIKLVIFITILNVI